MTLIRLLGERLGGELLDLGVGEGFPQGRGLYGENVPPSPADDL